MKINKIELKKGAKRMAFQFPKELNINGTIYHLLYDPAVGGVMPELNTPKVQSCAGQWVNVPSPNGNSQVWMVMVDLIYPAQTLPSGIRPPQLVKAFKVMPTQMQPETVPPQEMVMYIRELPAGEGFQDVINAVLGTAVSQRKPADTQWADKVFNGVTNE